MVQRDMDFGNMSMKARRILILLSEVNGSEQLEDLLKRLHEEMHEIRIIFMGDRTSEIVKNLKNTGVQILILRPYGLRSFFRNGPWIVMDVLLKRPSVVFASGQTATYLGMPIAWFFFIQERVHIRHHSNFHHKFGHQKGVCADKLMNFFSTKVIAVSELVKEILLRDENCKVAKIQVIHNGVRLQKYLGIKTSSQDIVRFGAISRFTELKGLEFIASAFVKFQKERPKSHLEIVGAFSDSYDLVLSILSQIPPESYSLRSSHPDIPSFLKSLDCFIHVPIAPYDESFGLVYIECLASKTQGIFTKSGILLEIPNIEEYSLIVPPCDDDAIFSAMMGIADGKHDSALIPVSELEKYSTLRMVENYLKILNPISPN
jgi:glycosyltransferase involved in cell wall biosynthesis